MALSRALFSGISGLKGQQIKLDVIGNNISNINTAGFKRSRVTFQDLFSDTTNEGNAPSDRVGGSNPSQVGLGIIRPTIEQIHTEGPTVQTGVATDLSMSGEGFFIINDGNENLYTRDGDFKLDQTGDMVMSGSNLRIQGWMAQRDDDGKFLVDTARGLETINLQANRKQYAVATDEVTFASNLDSGSSVRNIEQAETSIQFRDNSSTSEDKQKLQKISWGFTKIDATHYDWISTDTNGAVIATGSLEFSDFGEILDSTVYPAGDTTVNYDPTDPRYQDIFTTTSAGLIDPDNFLKNQPDNLADMVMDPNAKDFMELGKAARPRAISFTYDPDGAFSAGRWSNPHGIKDLTSDSETVSTEKLNGDGSINLTPAVAFPANVSIRNVVINNSRENEKNGLTLQNYEGDARKSSSGQIQVRVIADPSGEKDSNGNDKYMAVEVYKDYWGSDDGNGVSLKESIGTFYGLDRSVSDHKLAIPGLMSFTLSDANAPSTGWDITSHATIDDGFFFSSQSSGSFNPIDDGRFFTGLASVFHDENGPNKFEIRNVDATNSEYSGDLRVTFNGPTSFQIIDDNNVVLTQGVLRDGETDTEVEVAGINFTFHREGLSLLPKDTDDQGFLGTEIKLNGFVEAEGKSGPVTVDIPKISDINLKTGQILKAEKDISYNVGFSQATASPRKGFADGTAAGDTGGSLTKLNETIPGGSVTIDASRAAATAQGTYRIEFGVRNDYGPNGLNLANFDPYAPHNDPGTDPAVTGKDSEDLNNQVIKVYKDGESQPSFIIDLNPQDDANGDTAQQLGLDGQPAQKSNFVPPYNFFAEMQNYRPTDKTGTGFLGDATVAKAKVSPTFQDQYKQVTRQVNLPNGVIINISNIGNNNKVGTLSASAYGGSANFFPGDEYTFDITSTGSGGIQPIDSYSAAFKQGAQHATTIEIFDSLGGSHNLTTTYEHVNKITGEWNYYLSLDSDDPLIQEFLFNPPAGFQVENPRKPTDEELRKANETIFTRGRQGKLFFNKDGSIDTFNSRIPEARFTPSDASEVKIKLDKALITQFEAEFGAAARERTGNAMGLLQGFTIESSGAIKGSFDNGSKVEIARIAVASFKNPEGLSKKGSNTFTTSTNSGIANIGIAGSDDRGLMNSGVLESSNVDLTDEFTELIITQRSFSANGRIITTSDEFLQEILSLKR